MAFGSMLFEYLTSVVPYWRISDDAWRLGDGSYLTGIGVLRNCGGDLLVVPCELNAKLPKLARTLEVAANYEITSNVVVVVDDRSTEAFELIMQELPAVRAVRWTERQELQGMLELQPP